MNGPARGGWLHRNAVALTVAVISAAGCVAVLLGLPLLDRASNAQEPAVVPYGESVTSQGYEFELLVSAEFPGTGEGGNGVPVGMALVAAVVDVRPLDDADPELSCDTELTSRTTGTERAWTELIAPGDFRYRLDENSDDICSPDGEPLRYEVVYLTPEGSYEGATVELTVNGEVFRLELEP